MPCPEGVNIPICFEMYNNLYMSGNADETKFFYAAQLSGAVSAGETGFASQCVKCGQCLEKCPQQLDIPTILKSAVEEFEGPDLENRVAMAKQVFLKK
jgi:predicted aldo/keto reductase-like oxidoreductase